MLGDETQSDLVIEPIIGWRSWLVDYDTGNFKSPDRGDQWVDGNLQWDGTCSCALSGGLCHCGINAFATRQQLAERAYFDHMAIGSVALSGTVRQFPLGWRAQKAQVYEVWARNLIYEHKVRQAALKVGATYRGIIDDGFADMQEIADRWRKVHRKSARFLRAAAALWILGNICAIIGLGVWLVATMAALGAAMICCFASAQQAWQLQTFRAPSSESSSKQSWLLLGSAMLCVFMFTAAPAIIVLDIIVRR